MSDDQILFLQKSATTLSEMTGPKVQEMLKRTSVVTPCGRYRGLRAYLLWTQIAWRHAKSVGALPFFTLAREETGGKGYTVIVD